MVSRFSIYKLKVSFAIWLFLSIICVSNSFGQPPAKLTSGQIYNGIEKLGVLGSVLYIAAHPDDENTRLIAYLATGQKAETTYLSLTRGDGGQNLIGTEMSELLGVLRTQELLMARTVDNGNQMFSRANDFGYSKNAEETIKIWDTEKVKADVVWAIRTVRPDVIINRFDHRTSGETHGHHTASAQLSYELFEKAGDSTVYKEQLSLVSPWTPRRLFFNTSWWFYGSEDKFNKADKSRLMSIDVGTFEPLLGKSVTEIAAESRSKHKCQGFGSTGTRGSQQEYLELLKGDLPTNKEDIFEGINTTWTRVKGGQGIDKMIEVIKKEYDFNAPYKSIEKLIKLSKAIDKTKDDFWKPKKQEEVKKLIAAAAGLFIEAKTSTHKAVANESITIDLECVNRSKGIISLVKIKGIGFELDTTMATPLEENEQLKWSKTIFIPADTKLTAPYWLTSDGELGIYQVDEQALIGMPNTPRSLKITFTLKIGDQLIDYTKDLIYKYNSPENGETYRPFEIVPEITVKVNEPVYIFNDVQPRDVVVAVTAWQENKSGTLTLPLPKGWTSIPKKIDFNIKQKGETSLFTFSVFPPKEASEIQITPLVTTLDPNGKNQSFTQEIIDINYDHIPFQTVVRKAKAKLAKLDIKVQSIMNNTAPRIAYVMGAGDEVPQALKQIGYQVDMLKASDVTAEALQPYQALILGVRAYNTQEDLKFKQAEIFKYIERGGNVVVQYNTANGLVTKELAPFPLKLSRNRVTVEEAEIRFIAPNHALLNKPNKITSKDFDGWVQERGLYFSNEWDSAFTPIISCNDPNEDPNDGAILVANYGKGSFIYTSLSFFRELPAGVSGAYRLFANLISYRNDSTEP